MVYSFTANNVASAHSSNGKIVVQITDSTISGFTSAALPSLDWSSNIVHADRDIMCSPKISKGGELIPGDIPVVGASIEFTNLPFNLTTQTRMSDVLIYNPYTTALHCRIGYISDAKIGTLQWEYGTIDYNSVKIKMGNYNNPDTWGVGFDISDGLKILDTITVDNWLSTHYPVATYGISATNTYISTLTSTTTSYCRGRAKVTDIFLYDYNETFVDLDGIQQPQSAEGLTYVSLTSLFSAISESMGLEAPINNGAAWSTCVTTTWWINKVDYIGITTDPNRLDNILFQQLYMLYDWYYLGSYHRSNWTLFDLDKLTASALTSKGSMLEAMKYLCSSLGLQCRLAINNDGERYLIVEEYGRTYDVYKSDMIDNTLINQDIEVIPYPETIDGIQINTAFGSTFTFGIAGGNYLNADMSAFVMGQNIVTKYAYAPHIIVRDNPLIGYGRFVSGVSPWEIQVDRGWKELFQSLWASQDVPSGKYVNNMYTVCAVRPERNNIPIPATAGDGYQNYPGAFDGTGMLFPNYKSGFNSFEDGFSYWLAAYYFSVQSYDNDPIGATRRYQREIEIHYPKVIHNSMARVGQEVELAIAGITHTWVIKSIDIDLADFSSKIVLRSRDYTL